MKHTIIIGAGYTGATCAHALRSSGALVTVLDKARGPGGRCSRRRAVVNGQDVVWTHGAHHIDTDHPLFADCDDPHAVIRSLVEPAIFSTHVREIQLPQRGVNVVCDDGIVHHADRVLVTIPVPQFLALPLVGSTIQPTLIQDLHSIQYSSRIAFLLAGTNITDALLKGAAPPKSEIRWHITEESISVLTILAPPSWSEQHLEASLSDLASTTEATLVRSGASIAACHVHRWRYAQPRQQSTIGPIVDCSGDGRILLAGDAFGLDAWKAVSLHTQFTPSTS